MRKTHKKIIAILLASFMMLTPVSAANAETEQNIINLETVNTIHSSFEKTMDYLNEVYKKQQEVKEAEVQLKIRETKNEVKEIRLSLNPKKSVPLYNQLDYPNTPYGDYGTIASHGCGITSLAMISTYYLNEECSPDKLAEQFGDYNTEKGSLWVLFEDSAAELGLPLQERTDDTQKVIEALKNEQVVISLQGPGLFTSGGHFIVLVGMNASGKIIVNDPNGANYEKNETLIDGFMHGFTAEQIFESGGPYWIYEKKTMQATENDTKTIIVENNIIKATEK